VPPPRVPDAALAAGDTGPTTSDRTRRAIALGAVLVTVASVAGLALALSGPDEPTEVSIAPPLAPPLEAPEPVPAPEVPPPAELRETSVPAGRPVFVDARPLGTTPAIVPLEAGAHRVEVRGDDGSLLAGEEVVLEAGEVRELTMTLPAAPALATLRVDSTPPGATVRIDGEEAGATPFLAEVVPIRHRVDVELEGYAPAGSEVILERPGEQATLAFALTRTRTRTPRGGGTARTGESGGLTIATTPWSEVYLGRRHLGTTPLANVPLPAGTHTLTLRSPGRAARRESVTIRAGETTRVRLVL
jgi:hypothetical protein